jgi:mannose-6-phosphate isomerase-like protein (cupin superfamily)
VNIKSATLSNTAYRTALWTGAHLQVTLMSIGVGDDIGLEVHPNTDQFLCIEEGHGLVQMGVSKDYLTCVQSVFADCAVFVPAGTWHNITNMGNTPMKIYSIYAPPHHPYGTIQPTKESPEMYPGGSPSY